MPDVPGVLADLLVFASEAGSERLVETDRLLRELVGADAVNEAHAAWTDRLREGLSFRADAPGRSPTPSGDVFDLARSLRASTPGRRGGRW